MNDNQEIVSLKSPEVPEVPQFQTAEYAGIPGTERCGFCGNLITGEYYRVNNQMACTSCGRQVRDGVPKDSHAAFTRGLLLGCGAALVGLIVYATFTIVTNFYIGYMALAVGWFVANAITKGSNGMGGRRYQIAAVLLTYAAISVAAVPIAIGAYVKQEKKAAQQHQSSASATLDDANAAGASRTGAGRPSAGAAVASLLLMGIASPFLELQDPVHGAIGLFILFIGLRIAWQLTAAKPLQLDGPYSITAG